LKEVGSTLAFLMVTKFEDEKYIGGIMATDGYGIPLEFRYSEPVKPTGLQKILYGRSIEKYLTIDVIAKKLLQSIAEKPRLVFVNEYFLLQIQSKYPVILLTSVLKETQEEAPENESELKTELFGNNCKAVYPANLILDDIQWLKAISNEIDILEPFIRLKEALVYVCSKG